MNPRAVSTLLAVSMSCATFALAQRTTKMNLGEGEAKARKILLEKAAKEGKVFSAAAATTATITHWSGVISWAGHNYSFNMLGHNPAKGSSTTVIPVYVVPVKITLPTAQFGTRRPLR